MHRKSNAGDSRGEFLNYTYMLKCSDGTLYTGWTNDLEKRVEAHNSGKGAKYTKARRPVELAYYEEFETKEQAMKREYAIKQLGRKEKQKLIAGKEVKLSDKRKEKEAFKVAENKIKKHKLKMNLTDVEYKFDNSKITFYFTSDGRVDFRELVKDLAAIYKTRIELRQIGVRDEVRRIGGNGVCGRELCCCTFLNDFEAVSIKMAKDQNISLNPSKISGNCGRLMCCLKYEDEAYLDKLKNLPNVGAIVKTEDGIGEVDNIEILKEKLRIKFKGEDGYTYKKYDAKDVLVIKDVAREQVDEEEIQNKKELEELEKLEQEDKKVLGGEKNGI